MTKHITTMYDAFYERIVKGNYALLLFWSQDWLSLRPWTYNREKIPYISQFTYEREIGRMTSTFVGPLCIVYYKMKK